MRIPSGRGPIEPALPPARRPRFLRRRQCARYQCPADLHSHASRPVPHTHPRHFRDSSSQAPAGKPLPQQPRPFPSPRPRIAAPSYRDCQGHSRRHEDAKWPGGLSGQSRCGRFSSAHPDRHSVPAPFPERCSLPAAAEAFAPWQIPSALYEFPARPRGSVSSGAGPQKRLSVQGQADTSMTLAFPPQGPPSTRRMTPVVKLEESVARYKAAVTISSGRPGR